MFDEPFRVEFAKLSRPVVPALVRLRVTPNHVTVMGFVMAVVAAALIAIGWAWSGLAIWLVSRLGDGLDGMLARETGATTAFGGYLDITLDMCGYSAMVIGFSFAHPGLYPAWMAVLGGYVLVITTTLAFSDAARGAGRQISVTKRTFQFTPGITEAGETNVMYALWTMFPAELDWLVWFWVVALVATGVQRTVLAWRALR